jgi:hypothetical protein
VPALTSGATIRDSVWRTVLIQWTPAAPVIIGTKYDRTLTATSCTTPGTFVDQCGNTVAWSSLPCTAGNINCNTMAVSSGTYTVSYNGVVRQSVTLNLEALLNNNGGQFGTNIPKDVIFGFTASTEGKTNYQAIRNPVFLPVEYVSFYAVKKSDSSVELIWSTATEKNSLSYTVERSQDGRSWETAGSINAAGNSSNITYYSFTDEKLLPNTYYYRLLETDIDGKISTSKTISINLAGTLPNVDIFPNPVKQGESLKLQISERNCSVEVIDMNGKIISSQRYFSSTEAELPTDNIKSGVYFIKIISENGVVVKKLIVE